MRRRGPAQSNSQSDSRSPRCGRHRAALAPVVVVASLGLIVPAVSGSRGARAGAVGGEAKTVVGHVRTTRGEVTLGRGIPVTKKADLHSGDLLMIGPTGEAELDLMVKGTKCTVGRDTQLRVLPSANVAYQLLGDGDLTCGTGSRSRRPAKVMGPNGTFVISMVDPVFKISVRRRRSTIKVDRGSLVVTGPTGRRRGVVLARKQQSVVPAGGDSRAPRSMTLTPPERAVFVSLERTLPAPTDTTAPTTTILAGPGTQTGKRTATFTFQASEAGVSFSCSLDGGDFRVCSSPASLSSLSAGRHRFAVGATDTAGNAGRAATYSWRITSTAYRQVIARDATDVHLSVDARGRARVTFRADGRAQSVLAWGAINARPSKDGNDQELFNLMYGAAPIRNVCGPYTGPPLAWLVTACTAPDGTHWALQQWQRGLPVFGVPPSTPEQAGFELHLSHWSGPIANLEIKTDWAYRKYDHLYGRLTYRGQPVYGFTSTSQGTPLDNFGRNIYLDTYDSAYGPGWKREIGLLTHRPTGAFCYGFYPHGQRPAGNGTRYRATVVGPGVTPDLRWEAIAPGPYDPVRDAAANAEQQQLLAGDKSCKIN
jgi:hypothetical protein